MSTNNRANFLTISLHRLAEGSDEQSSVYIYVGLLVGMLTANTSANFAFPYNSFPQTDKHLQCAYFDLSEYLCVVVFLQCVCLCLFEVFPQMSVVVPTSSVFAFNSSRKWRQRDPGQFPSPLAAVTATLTSGTFCRRQNRMQFGYRIFNCCNFSLRERSVSLSRSLLRTNPAPTNRLTD